MRGEDSLVRALWAAKPWVWQIYPQHDGAHGPKLEALMNRLGMADYLRQFTREWNGLAPWSNGGVKLLSKLRALEKGAKEMCWNQAAQQDLTTQLIQAALHSS